MIVPAHLLDRLQHLEARILELATQFEPLVDVRAASVDPSRTLESMLVRLQALTNAMREREEAAEWDAVDQLAARLMLQTLADVAVELRRAFAAGATLIDTAAQQIHTARRALDSLERELNPPSADPQQ